MAQLQEAKSNIEAEKTAVEEDRAMQLLLNKAEVSFLSTLIRSFPQDNDILAVVLYTFLY